MASVLISGGTGFIGKSLQKKLHQKGHRVKVLSRYRSNNSSHYYWDVAAGFVEEAALQNTDFIIHLAGAGIADKRWTIRRKAVLTESRVDSAKLLLEKVRTLGLPIQGFIAASGIGYYGANTTDKIYSEGDEAGKDFLGTLCEEWEVASLAFEASGIRTAIFRTGIVFANEQGAFQKINNLIRKGLGAPLGTGQQYMPWIHLEDLCTMYVTAVEDPGIRGIYNAVAPEHLTNKALTLLLSASLNRKIWLPAVPSCLLRLRYGEMADLLLEGSRVSATKIQEAGIDFNYPTLGKALKR
ncbi:MAG: TIGR01777 family oxidoreductase [Lutibacter sp.]|nr:TIGR01777 family oxidoreductase [Lutibacter sp.]